MKTTNACDIAPLATHRPATTHTPLDAWLDSEIRMATLVLPLARKPPSASRWKTSLTTSARGRIPQSRKTSAPTPPARYK